jgi:hypothetical protein
MRLRGNAGRQGLDKKLKHARAIHPLIFLSRVVGVELDFVGTASVKALYWTAVANGCWFHFLLAAIVVIASDNKLMQGQLSCSVDSVSRLGENQCRLRTNGKRWVTNSPWTGPI